jgi:hypothetical protein
VASPRSPVAELLAALAGALEALGVRWYLFGAQAAIVHGAVRLTADVDVTVKLGERDLPALLTALVRASFEPRVADAEAFAGAQRVLPMAHRRTQLPLDLVLAGPGPEDLFLERAEPRSLEGVTVPVACAEDLVAMKVLSGRPKDLEDAAAIVAARGSRFDARLARETLAQFERALDRNDLLPELERLVRHGPQG